MSCRDCLHLNVLPDKNGKITPRRGSAYRCLAPVSDLPPLPASVNPPHWPPSKSYMEPDDGEGCSEHVTRNRPAKLSDAVSRTTRQDR